MQSQPVCRKISDILEALMNIETLRKLANREEIDYQFLMSALQDYARPREKVSEWLKKGVLTRVKKGIYVFGREIAQSPYSLEVLANLIYGPSAISLTYALSFHGLIPERVSLLTCITNKRNKFFNTAVGNFVYYYLHPKKYPIGIELKTIAPKKQVFMASPEKALCDQIYLIDKTLEFKNVTDVEKYLLFDLRLDETLLRKFSKKKLSVIVDVYNDQNLTQLEQFFKKWKK